jgi:GT2 family glycosyltransferase
MNNITTINSSDWIEASARRLNALASRLGCTSYLEIGVSTGHTFLQVSVEYRTGVDPFFNFDYETYHDGIKTKLISATSDAFFSGLDPSQKYDLIYLDGLHTYDQTYRDLQNALLHSHERTAILIDDTWPCDVFSTSRDMGSAQSFRLKATGSRDLRWHGDTYKLVPLLKLFHRDHHYVTIIERGNPQTLLWRKQERKPLAKEGQHDPSSMEALIALDNLSACDYLWFLQNQELYNPSGEEEALARAIDDLTTGEQPQDTKKPNSVSTHETEISPPLGNATQIYSALEVDETLTVGIAAYGNQAMTKRCLEALFTSLKGNYELILIDDNSPDEGATLSLLRDAQAAHDNSKVFSFQTNQEYSGSLNAILSHAKGERVLFVSNDIIVTPTYFEMLIKAEIQNGPGIYRGSSNFVDNGLDSHNIYTSLDVQTLAEAIETSKEVSCLYSSLAVQDEYLTGDAFMVSRSVIDAIGTIDPLFYGYFADPDYGLRAERAGFPLVLVPGAWAYHHRGSNFSYLQESEMQKKIGRRWQRIYENWARFKLKYDLPVSLPYSDINAIPWRNLASKEFDASQDYCKPLDYSGFLV